MRPSGLSAVGGEADVDAPLVGFGQFVRGALDEGEGLVQVAAEQLGTLRPLQAAAVAGPAQPFAGIAGDAGLRQGLPSGAMRPGAAGGDEGSDIGLEPFGPADPVAVGRNGELGRPFAGQVGAFVVAVEVDRDQGALVAVAAGQEQAVAGRRRTAGPRRRR
jgi:hypothetical protein